MIIYFCPIQTVIIGSKYCTAVMCRFQLCWDRGPESTMMSRRCSDTNRTVPMHRTVMLRVFPRSRTATFRFRMYHVVASCAAVYRELSVYLDSQLIAPHLRFHLISCIPTSPPVFRQHLTTPVIVCSRPAPSPELTIMPLGQMPCI